MKEQSFESRATSLSEQELPPVELFSPQEMEFIQRVIEMQDARTGTRSLRERESEYQSRIDTDRKIGVMARYERILYKMLERYGCKNFEIKKIGNDLFAVTTNEAAAMLGKDIPFGCAYAGGAARAMLFRALGRDESAIPRDVDIVAINAELDDATLEILSHDLMPEDYAGGHGIKREHASYFFDRDFTVNEVLATGKVVYCTRACLLDTLRGVIRFSEFEKRESYQEDAPYYVHPKLLAKALRFVALYKMEIADTEVYEFQQIDLFHMGLHLDRAMTQGREIAERYVKELQTRGQIPVDVVTLSELCCYISDNSNFVFRCVSFDMLAEEQKMLDADNPESVWSDYEKAYEHMPMRGPMHRPSRVRKSGYKK